MNKTFKLITAWAAVIGGSALIGISIYNVIIINL